LNPPPPEYVPVSEYGKIMLAISRDKNSVVKKTNNNKTFNIRRIGKKLLSYEVKNSKFV